MATFENPNYLGNFAACAFPVLLALFFIPGRTLERSVVGTAAVLSYGACILAGSRGAWIAGLGGTVIVLGGVILAVRRGGIRLRWLSVSILALALLGTTYVATRDPLLLTRMETFRPESVYLVLYIF